MSAQLFIKEIANSPESDTDSYYEYFKDSIGKGNGKYFNGIGEVYRSSSRYQKGYGLLGTSQSAFRGEGLGNILSSLWRVAFPMLKTGAKTLGSAALDVATNVASDALKGRDIKESAKEHLTTKGTELLQTINPALGKTPAHESETFSPSQTVLAAPPPKPVLRRLPQKRAKQTKVSVAKLRSKQARFPALKYM